MQKIFMSRLIWSSLTHRMQSRQNISRLNAVPDLSHQTECSPGTISLSRMKLRYNFSHPNAVPHLSLMRRENKICQKDSAHTAPGPSICPQMPLKHLPTEPSPNAGPLCFPPLQKHIYAIILPYYPLYSYVYVL